MKEIKRKGPTPIGKRRVFIEIQKNLKIMGECLELHHEYWQIDAKIKKGRFDALVKEGFNQAQAIELLKTYTRKE